MKILVLADEEDQMLWEHLDRRRLEGIDLIISCGDLSASYLSFLTCFTAAPILYVHGNHDVRYQEKPPEGCICVDGRVYVHNGIRIMGLGGSMRYKPGPYQYTESEMKKRIMKLLPSIWWHRGVDILVTHAPAKDLGDGTDRAHKGFEAFRWLMQRYRPKFMMHGHVHKTYTHDFKREVRWESTTIVNGWTSYVVEFDA